jgi:hypothetical protein
MSLYNPVLQSVLNSLQIPGIACRTPAALPRSECMILIGHD